MAWNEPGGNGKNQDPWGGGGRSGGGGGDQGPPDLDEALKKLQEKMNGIFGGGKRRGGGSSGGPNLGRGGILLLLVALVAVWGFMGVYTVNEQERVVVLRLGKYHDTVMPGLRWNPPLLDSRYPVNVTQVRSKDHRALMLTEDENIVEVGLKVQYQVTEPKAFVLNVRDPEVSLAHATESALRHVVGTSEMHYILTEGRALLGTEVQERIQDYMTDYGTGLRISKVNIETTQAPSQVQAAFDDVIKAREDEQRVKNQAEAYANGIVPEARGEAQRLLEEANAYREEVIAKAEGETSRFKALLAEYRQAPGVTRERMYLDAVESVLSSSTKVLMDVEGGNNIMYLPLDKIVDRTTATQNITSGTQRLDETSVDEVANEVIERLRRRQASTRREGR
ncbi:FtsH protease activity modulator HflK [Motiliproteus sp. SC1-56]|uniref:FtsH protease activity modulator HflK n=1 Tax=Motiliproteus sp. SC1-56 TaxID=2799565 RepID=UPI001A8CA197|nr:FtsH protease activity modulator HflK [Motiliproteus sp. SC1-56]